MPVPRLLLLIATLVVLAIFVQFGLVSIAFEKLGLSRGSAYLLLLTTLVGSVINLPLFSIAADPDVVEPPQQELYKLLGVPRLKFTGRTVIAINVGGAVVPMAFSLYLLLHNPLDPLQAAEVVAIVAAIAYVTSRPIRGVGIGMPMLLAPLAAALSSMLINPDLAAPLAYIGGTLGVLIGADLLRLGSIRKLGAPIASIGGGGSFDGIFLSGMLAVLLA